MADSLFEVKPLQPMPHQIQHIKEFSYDGMCIQRGDHVLDLACGSGVDTIALARRVGQDGHVVGVDVDEGLLVQADAAAREAGVAGWTRYFQAEATALPFADHAFDACRAEGLLQDLAVAEAGSVFAELWRVTRPGGWVVLGDADWATASVDVLDTELERRLARFFADALCPNAYAGRQLYRLFTVQGFEQIALEIFPVGHGILATTHYDHLMREAVRQGVADEAETLGLRKEMERAEQEGRFLACVNMIFVVGRKPDAVGEENA